jgi:DNA-binding MarR family transcriptional regulator
MAAPEPMPVEQAAPSDLDHRLAATLERVGHVIRTLLWREAYAHGLSPTQTQLVLHLAGKVRPPRVTALAAEFDVSLATISDALAALRRKGLVERRADPADRRGSAFALTEAGRGLAADLSRWYAPVVDALGGESEADKAATLRLLLDLVGRLAAVGALAVANTCVTCRFFARDVHADPDHPHHCRLLDTPFGDARLRLDCAEHQPRERD